MKRKQLLTLALVSCIVIAGTTGLRAAAAASAIASTGNFVTDDGKMAFYGGDVAYLDYEISALRTEIDYSIFNEVLSDNTVLSVTDSRRDLLTSHGIIVYDNDKVVISSMDLMNIADGIDGLENDYTAMTSTALNNISTYFDIDGNVNHASQTEEYIFLNCEQLVEGILQSQSVDHLEVTPVIEDNITAGAAAWVNGKCIIGNGADNETAYQHGMEDGAAGNTDNVEIQYLYHEHTGNSGKNPIPDGDVYYSTNNPGGCYGASGHTHNQAGLSCPGEYNCTECHHSGKIEGNVSSSSVPACSYHGRSKMEVVHFSDSGKEYTNYWCNGTREPHDHITCSSSQVNTWIISCGKRAGKTVDEATVVIH